MFDDDEYSCAEIQLYVDDSDVTVMMMIVMMKSFSGMTAMSSTITGQREHLVTPSESHKSGKHYYLLKILKFYKKLLFSCTASWRPHTDCLQWFTGTSG